MFIKPIHWYNQKHKLNGSTEISTYKMNEIEKK